MYQRGFAPIILSLILALISVGAAYFYGVKQGRQSNVIKTSPSPSAEGVFCTQDAMQCPDGSYVGHTGPNCEFTACPAGTIDTSNWKTYKGETLYTTDGSTIFTIKYPAKWVLEGSKLYPLGKSSKAVFTLGAGGHGTSAIPIKKSFKAGEASYYWDVALDGNVFAFATFSKENKDYIFEVNGLPGKYSDEYEKVFNQMLNTFEPVPE